MQATILKDVSIQAFYALIDNKLRASLSVLIISFGIAAVFAVGSASEAFKKYIYAELQTYGLKSVWIYRDWEEEGNPERSQRQGSGITNEDLRNLKKGCCPSIVLTTPTVYVDEETPVNVGNKFADSVVEGVGIHYLEINNDQLSIGRNLRNEDISRRKPVAIIGSKIADQLYGKGRRVLGKTFRLFQQKFLIIGILSDKNRDLLAKIGADTYDINSRILVPYTIYQQVLGSKDIHTLQAEAISMAETHEAVDQLENVLRRAHAGKYKYKKETMDEWIAEANNVRFWIAAGGMGGAFIILLIGGMGVMNIMSTSVIERTREIGIRKALGAQYSDVLIQFLFESIYVTTIGGIIGLLLGVAVIYISSWIIGYEFHPTWLMAVIALVVSTAVGILSGYYPAHRAALMRPVDALRYE